MNEQSQWMKDRLMNLLKPYPVEYLIKLQEEEYSKVEMMEGQHPKHPMKNEPLEEYSEIPHVKCLMKKR